MCEKNEIVNFIERIIQKDIQDNKHAGKLITRFPPEPNGYLHIGHFKALNISFSLAEKYNGYTNLRFDDTNPLKESTEFVDAIKEDILWLGYKWQNIFFASDYFGKMYDYAIDLIKKDKAYVDDLTAEQIRDYRGTLTEPGKESPYRNRSIEENLELFQQMKNGEFKDGEKVLRAKIDMKSGNINMRDPVMYRIQHAHHHNTADNWCIYPMYDWAHGLEDSIEHVTHSLCSLEFEAHRPLYDWFLDELDIHHPQQIEFARLNLTHTVMSKRLLRALVESQLVDGWDDPRMPTLRGLRRRGYTPKALRTFIDIIGVSKADSTVDYALLEHCLREDLNKRAQRRMAVLDPVKLVITNYPEGKEEWFDADNNPEDENAGTRKIPFCRELFIEREDFMIDPPKKFFRLAPGKEIRLKHAYYITCTDYKTDSSGNITEIHATYDPDSRGGWTQDGRKVKGTSHWLSAKHAKNAEIRTYSHLFEHEHPGTLEGDLLDHVNKTSKQIVKNVKIEAVLAEADREELFQFLRKGYFVADWKDHSPENPVFNQSTGLRDSWSKKMK